MTTTILAEQTCICPMFPLVPLILLDKATPAYEGHWNRCCLAVIPSFTDQFVRWIPGTN